MKYEIERTREFSDWLTGLKDIRGKARILARVDRIKHDGHFGDSESVGDGIGELRFFFGPGYRIYYAVIGERVVLLINGGDKSTQKRDVKRAKELLRELE